jgi:hypothetical protein
MADAGDFWVRRHSISKQKEKTKGKPYGKTIKKEQKSS